MEKKYIFGSRACQLIKETPGDGGEETKRGGGGGEGDKVKRMEKELQKLKGGEIFANIGKRHMARRMERRQGEKRRGALGSTLSGGSYCVCTACIHLGC